MRLVRWPAHWGEPSARDAKLRAMRPATAAGTRIGAGQWEGGGDGGARNGGRAGDPGRRRRRRRVRGCGGGGLWPCAPRDRSGVLDPQAAHARCGALAPVAALGRPGRIRPATRDVVGRDWPRRLLGTLDPPRIGQPYVLYISTCGRGRARAQRQRAVLRLRGTCRNGNLRRMFQKRRTSLHTGVMALDPDPCG